MSDDKETIVFLCDHIGVAGTTGCHVKKRGDYYEARIGIAMMGMTNMDEAGFLNCNRDPFHPEFYDNYASGKGITPEAAISAMKKDMKSMSESLWAF